VAGIRPGDAIQSFNEIRISQPFSLVALLENVDPDEPNEAVIVRGGEEITCTIAGVTPLPLEERAF
jgi:S1-C subfamily serine protease